MARKKQTPKKRNLKKYSKPKPSSPAFLVPHKFPSFGNNSKTKLFLTKKDTLQMTKEIELIKKTGVYQDLTLPSGKRLTQITPEGKITALINSYSAKSPFFLTTMSKKEFEKTLEIYKQLSEKGILVPEIIESSFSENKYHVLTKNSGTSLFNLNQQKKVTIKDIENYLKTMSVLHSLGISHNHPHAANFFKKNNKIGIFDFSSAKKEKINWNNPNTILNAFKIDFQIVFTNLTVLSKQNIELHNLIKTKNISSLFEILLEKLPISQEIRNMLVQELSTSFLYHYSQYLAIQKQQKRLFKK